MMQLVGISKGAQLTKVWFWVVMSWRYGHQTYNRQRKVPAMINEPLGIFWPYTALLNFTTLIYLYEQFAEKGTSICIKTCANLLGKTLGVY
jgi:hypothetical protein